MIDSKDNYHQMATTEWAHWFRDEYFCFRRKFVMLNPAIDPTKPGCYYPNQVVNVQPESWDKTAMRLTFLILPILIATSIIFRVGFPTSIHVSHLDNWKKIAAIIVSLSSIISSGLGFSCILLDDKHWRDYMKTPDYAERKEAWGSLFAKIPGSSQVYPDQEPLLEAMVRSNYMPSQLRFDHITAKNLHFNANKFFGGEGEFDHSDAPEHFKKPLAALIQTYILSEPDLEILYKEQPFLKGKTSFYTFDSRDLYNLSAYPRLSKGMTAFFFK